MRLRAAAGRTIKRPYVANQTLQPTELAGFNELFDDLDGTRADWLGLGVDVRASEAVQLGAEATLRSLSFQVAPPGGHRHDTQDDDRAMAYLYWTPTDRIATSVSLIGESFSAKDQDNPDVLDLRTIAAPVQLTYTLPAGWFATARTTFVAQDVDLPGGAGSQTDLDSHGVLVDLAAGYRLPKRRGIIALEITNLFDERLFFQDDTFRSGRAEANPRFLPSREVLHRLP